MANDEKLQKIVSDLHAQGLGISCSPEGVVSASVDKQAPREKKLNLTIHAPMASYHFDKNGSHVSGFNEFNPGIGLGSDISENSAAFVVSYHNSYKDDATVAGVNYTPFKKQIGDITASLGATTGVSYTAGGSYARDMPKLSDGKFTAIAGLYASMEHVPDGAGVEATILPPVGDKGIGVVALSAFKRL